MRLVRYNVAASLDGFIATVDGGYDWIPEDPTVDFEAIFATVDTVVPVLLGAGVPLLAGGARRVPLQLIETHQYESGLMTLTYVPMSRQV